MTDTERKETIRRLKNIASLPDGHVLFLPDEGFEKKSYRLKPEDKERALRTIENLREKNDSR